MNELKVYLISDSTGDTAEQITKAVISQYKLKYQLLKHMEINDINKLEQVLAKVSGQKSIIIYTILDEGICTYLTNWCKEHEVSCIDLLNSVIKAMTDRSNTDYLMLPGVNKTLDREYYQRIGAIEFAVRYDDGKDPIGILLADVVLIGISRTSKTPLSMYLANKNLKVVNIPIIQDMELPKELYKIQREKIFGLTNNPENIYEIRLERLKAMGLDYESNYASIEKILSEINYAEDCMKKIGCPIINVSNKAIEETAEMIMRILI